jgi:hypothetical protein
MYRPDDFFDHHPVAFLILVLLGVIVMLTLKSCSSRWLFEPLLR